MPQDKARRALNFDQYEGIRSIPRANQEKALDEVFGIGPTKIPGGYPVPPTPYPFGKNPTDVAPEARSNASRLFSLFPGMQEKVDTITARPVPDYRSLGPGYEPGNANKLDVLGMYQGKDIFLRGGSGKSYNFDDEDTLAHELAHAQGFPHPYANLAGSMYKNYIDEINSKDRDIYLPYEPPLKKANMTKQGIGPTGTTKKVKK